MTRDPTSESTDAGLPTELEERVFASWIDRSPSERDAALVELCAEHPEHAEALRALGRRLRRSEGVLAPFDPDAVLERGGESDGDRPPRRIGPYEIGESLGEGGFGRVYRAEQTAPVRRTVAIKVLRSGRLGAEGLARFENERQALAVMDHPSIARIFDAGLTDGGQPYFVMEFIGGEPITVGCDMRMETVEHRLELFLQVCRAIDHAHHKGVVHRDLKPQNVLVSEVGGELLPRVIDFGIAKAVAGDVGAAPVSTLAGAMIGTPGYMSPEQAQGRPVDVRSDIYALGVLLYELLTGDLPFPRERLLSGNVVAIARLIIDDEPRSPSAAFAAASDPAAVAGRRGTEPDRLRGHLRSDLRWILRKCLEKEPDSRYGSVGQLIADISRYLAHQPVAARAPTGRYLLKKFVRRNRIAVGAAAAVAVLAALGVVQLVWALFAIGDARDQEVRHRHDAELQSYAAHVSAAKLAFDSGAIGSARRHLDDALPHLRGWEWHHVNAVCDGSDPVLDVGFEPARVDWLSPERLVVLERRGDRRVHVWDVPGGQPVRTLDRRGVAAIACDRAGERIVTLSSHGVELWQGESEGPSSVLVQPSPGVAGGVMAWDEAGRTLAFVHAGRVVVVDPGEPESMREVGVYSGTATALAISRVADRVALARADGSLVVLDLAAGAPAFEVQLEAESPTLAIDGMGARLFAAGERGITVYDLQTAAIERTIATANVDVRQMMRLVPAPDGARIWAAGGWAEAVVVAFDGATGEVVDRRHGHERGVRDLAVAPGGDRFATCGRDGTVRVWSARHRQRMGELEVGFDVRRMSYGPRGQRVAAAGTNGDYRVLDASDLRELCFGNVDERLYASALADDRLYIVGRRLHVIDITTGELVETAAAAALGEPEWTEKNEIARDLCVAADGSWLGVMSFDRVYGWSASAPSRVWRVELPEFAHCLERDPVSRLLAIGCADGVVRLLDPATGEEREQLTGLGPTDAREVDPGALGRLPIYDLACHDDRIAAAGADGRVRVLDRRSGAVLELRGHELIASGVTFSPDGTRIVTGGGDGYVRVWEARTGLELLALRQRTEVAHAVAFSPDGRRLATLYHVWDAPSFLGWWHAPAR